MKVVINNCYGGFSLSDEAYKRLIELGFPYHSQDEEVESDDLYILSYYPSYRLSEKRLHYTFANEYREGNENRVRNHPLVIQVVEELGVRANGACAELRIVEIPDDVKWCISEYDGLEHIAEQHRTWS